MRVKESQWLLNTKYLVVFQRENWNIKKKLINAR